MLLRYLTKVNSRFFSPKHGRISTRGLLRLSHMISSQMDSLVSTIVVYFTRLVFKVQILQPYHEDSDVIVTLDPNKFAEQKQKPLRICHRPLISRNDQLTPLMTSLTNFDRDYITRKQLSYSPDAKAFLYYSRSPERPRIAGEVRFRVTSSDDPASFESGSDLMRPDGMPWSSSLYFLSKYYFPLYEKLKEERFVQDDMESVLWNLPLHDDVWGQQCLHALNDAFIIDFSKNVTKLFVITEQGVESLPMIKLFFDYRKMFKKDKVPPYTGAYKNSSSLASLNIFIDS